MFFSVYSPGVYYAPKRGGGKKEEKEEGGEDRKLEEKENLWRSDFFFYSYTFQTDGAVFNALRHSSPSEIESVYVTQIKVKNVWAM